MRQTRQRPKLKLKHKVMPKLKAILRPRVKLKDRAILIPRTRATIGPVVISTPNLLASPAAWNDVQDNAPVDEAEPPFTSGQDLQSSPEASSQSVFPIHVGVFQVAVLETAKVTDVLPPTPSPQPVPSPASSGTYGLLELQDLEGDTKEYPQYIIRAWKPRSTGLAM